MCPHLLHTVDERGEERDENPDLYSMMRYVDKNLVLYEGQGRILTDDKAPVELLGMKVVDELINDQLSYYKKRFKGKSIKEMIDMLGV